MPSFDMEVVQEQIMNAVSLVNSVDGCLTVTVSHIIFRLQPSNTPMYWKSIRF